MKRILIGLLIGTVFLGLLVSGISCTKKATQVVYATPTPAPTSTFAPVNPKIIITYSSTTMTQIGTGYFPDTPRAGNVYLVLDMTIQNQAYNSFSVNPLYFSVVVNGVKYDTAVVIKLQNKLQAANVLNGETMSGNLAFEVPSSVTSTGFQPTYEGSGTYNVQWTRQ